MASPVDANRIGTIVSTAALSWNVNLPTGIVAGDLLIMYIRQAAAAGFNPQPTGWSLLVNDSTDASDDTTRVLYKWADGSETTPLAVPFNASIKGATIVWRVTGAANPATQVPQATGVNTFAAGASSASPPNGIGTGGSKDYLFLSLIGCDSETSVFTCAGLTNVTNSNSGTGGAVATNCVIAGGSVQATSANYGFPSWSFSGVSSGGSTVGIIIHPSGPSTQNVAATGKASSQAFGTVTTAAGPVSQSVTGLSSPQAFGTVVAKAVITVAVNGVGGVLPLYQAAVLANAPRAYWRLGASPLVDLSGNNNTLSIGGTAPSSAASLLPSDPFDGSRDFNSGQHYFGADSVSLAVSPPYSVEVWVETDTTASYQSMVYKYGRYVLRVENGYFVFVYFDGSNFWSFFSEPITAGTKYHVVHTDDGTTQRFYLNGVLSTTGARPTSGMGQSGANTTLYIGSGDWPFDGRLDEVAVYGTALSPTVLTHYQSGMAVSQFGTPTATTGAPPTPVSGVANAAAFGTVTTTARITRTVTGLGSAQAFGSIYLRVTLGSGGVLSAQAFGVPVPKAAITRAVGALASAQAFGTATTQTTVVRQVGSVASAQSFGTATPKATRTVTVGGVSSAQAFGPVGIPQTVQVVGLGPPFVASITGLVIVGDGHVVGGGYGTSGQFGTVTAVIGSVFPATVPVTGIASVAAFGAVTVQTVTRPAAGGVSSAQAFGAVTTVKGPVSRTVTGLGSAQSFGAVTPVVTGGGIQTAVVSGLASAQSFGAPVPKATVTRAVGSVATAQSFGTLTATARITCTVTGLGTAQAFGTPTAVLVGAGTPQTVPVQGLSLYVTVTSITGQVISGDGHTVGSSTYQLGQFGSLTIQARITKAVAGLGSAQSFGAARAANIVYAIGVPTAQRFGTTVARPGQVTILVSGLGSAQAFGGADAFLVWLHPFFCGDLDLVPAAETDIVLGVAGVTDITPVPATETDIALGGVSETDLDLVPAGCS